MPRPKKVLPTAPTAETVSIPKPPDPPAPQPTSPAVLALQASIVDMIEQRSHARSIVTAAQAKLYAAQADVQAATGQLQAMEQEVQYRMSIIAQMENRQSSNVVNFPQPAPDYYPQQALGLANISAEPTIQQRPSFSDPNDMVNRGSATRAML